MTDIEKQALELLNEGRVAEGWDPTDVSRVQEFQRVAWSVARIAAKKIHAEREAHEAYKREVSDAVEHYLNQWQNGAPSRGVFQCQFASFILPKPDQTVEFLNSLGMPDYEQHEFITALAARGGRIVFDQSVGGER